MKKIIIFILTISVNHLYSQIQIGFPFNTSNENEWIGWDVDMNNDGSLIAISSIAHPNFDSPDGKVSVYKRTDNEWLQVGDDIIVQDANNSFGYSISLSENGETLAIGSPSHDEPFNGCGAVRIYSVTETSISLNPDIIEGEEAFEGIGFSVDLSYDGTTLVIGSQNQEYSSVKVFEKQNDEWQLKGNPIVSDVYGDKFGYKVMIDSSGNTLAAIAPSLGVLNGELPNIKVFSYEVNDWLSNEDVITSSNFDNAVENFVLNNKGNLISAKQKDGLIGKISFYEIQNNQLEERSDIITGEEDFYLVNEELNFSNNGDGIAIEGSNKIKIFEFNTNEWMNTDFIIESEKVVHDIEYSEDGNFIIVSLNGTDYSEREVIVYRLDTVSSVFEKINTKLEVYPNPVHSHLLINSGETDYEIIEFGSGKKRKTRSSENGKIEVSDLNSGMYILSIKKGNTTTSIKFVKH